MRKILTSILILFCVVSFSQEVKILNETTKEPVSGVAAYNKSKTKSAISDFDGKIDISQFSDKEKITFQHLSFQTITLVKNTIKGIIQLKPNSQDLDEIVISASRFQQNKREVPNKIISIKSAEIQFNQPQTSADLLANSGQVFVQKSQLGGGSPMIRGFSTNRLLISVDGVRMNNAIFRGGNVQNVISIDPFTVNNTEIILGAGSVIYGSDAVGGVMNFYTPKPKPSNSDKVDFSSNIITRYATASNEKTGHINFNIGLKNWAFYTALSYTDFDDLEMGKHGPSDYLRNEYAVTNNGVDEVVQNDNPRLQKFTGYNQFNFLQKAFYRIDDNTNIDFALRYSATSDYPRYDRLIRYDENQLRSAEWYYGPQKWFMANAQLTRLSSSSSIHDKVKFSVAYQNYQESRNERNLFSENLRMREENVDVISANLDFEKDLSEKSEIFYGLEYLYNTVGSKGKQINILNSEAEAISTRYPNGSNWHSIASYLSYKYKPNKKFSFQSGLRYNYIIIDADFTENNEFYNLPFSKTNIETGALTGTAGLSWMPNKTINWKLNLATAFRAPNIDDVGKVFDSEPGSVVVPNKDLKPEYAYNGELGVALNFNDKIKINLATYYTYLDNALVRRDYNLNGETQIIYDDELSNVQAIQNASKAWIYGFEAGIDITLSKHLNFKSQYSIIGGTEEDETGMEVPVRHVAPAFGNAHVIWTKDKLKLDAFVNYNGKLSNSNLSPSVADYLFALDKNGEPYSPSWYTLNFRAKYNVMPNLEITSSLENITNQRYRTYSSGIAAPGLNFITSIKYSL